MKMKVEAFISFRKNAVAQNNLIKIIRVFRCHSKWMGAGKLDGLVL